MGLRQFAPRTILLTLELVMPAEWRCEKCGSALMTNGSNALCPKCLLSEGLVRSADFPHRPATARPGGEGTSRLGLVTEKPGDRIDQYKLLQQIGEGGMGVVYLAEQESPLRRRVALKILKPGVDTKAVLARFEIEQQALALMDHTNIAKVFDAGITLTGRSYFVMELVRGLRITDYCDQQRCSLQQRLDLFKQISLAVQHAHQKGIIHRDIKPSNILVTLTNGVPVPKIIDFGIAKATHQQRLTDRALFTTFEQFVGTPAYMSPEQAMMSRLDLDTRSDIYSLGVLLYELLTGRTPFDAHELLQLDLDEMRRKIREDEPQKPSTRLATLGPAAAAEVTKRFRLPAPKLVALVRGDLDWIVMRCLEKDRSRRYNTANGLAMDIQRYLVNEPVTARPPSAGYRLQKLIRRNRITFATVSAVAVALVFGLVLSTWMFLREKAESEKSQTVARFLKTSLERLNPALAQGRYTPMLHEILKQTGERITTELASQPEIQAELESIIGNAYYELRDFARAEAMYREALRVRQAVYGETHRLVASSLNDLGNALTMQNRHHEGERTHRQALAMRTRLFGHENAEVARSLASLADNLTDQRKLVDAETLQREALAIQRKLLGNENRDVYVSLDNLGRLLRYGERWTESETAFREALTAARGIQSIEVSKTQERLVKVLVAQDKLADAEVVGREMLALRRKLLDEEHPLVNGAFYSLAGLLQRQGKSSEVEAIYRERLQWLQGRLPAEEPEITATITGFAMALIEVGKFVEAERYARESLTLREKQLPGDWRVFISKSLLGISLLGQKKYAAAEPWLLSSYAGLQPDETRIPDYSKPYLKAVVQRLVELYEATDSPVPAAEWRRKLEVLNQPLPEDKPAIETEK